MNLYDTPTKPEPPERIYGWQTTQLSLARHYGGLTYQGRRYEIDYKAEGQPLVRTDVIKREAMDAERVKRKEWQEAKERQENLL